MSLDTCAYTWQSRRVLFYRRQGLGGAGGGCICAWRVMGQGSKATRGASGVPVGQTGSWTAPRWEAQLGAALTASGCGPPESPGPASAQLPSAPHSCDPPCAWAPGLLHPSVGLVQVALESPKRSRWTRLPSVLCEGGWGQVQGGHGGAGGAAPGGVAGGGGWPVGENGACGEQGSAQRLAHSLQRGGSVCITTPPRAPSQTTIQVMKS